MLSRFPEQDMSKLIFQNAMSSITTYQAHIYLGFEDWLRYWVGRWGLSELWSPLLTVSILPAATFTPSTCWQNHRRCQHCHQISNPQKYHGSSLSHSSPHPPFLKIPGSSPEDLLKQEVAKTALGTSWQLGCSESFFSPCSYLMSNCHAFPQTGARRWVVFLGVMPFHLACLTSLLTGHEMLGQMALGTLHRWVAGLQVCRVGEEAGETRGISSLEYTRKNSSSWGLSLFESLSD